MPHAFGVVVLGAGPGGYVAAIRAAQLGKSVAVVEEKYWGGVCLNVGCIPSKALLRNASTKVESVTDHGDRVTVACSRGGVQETVEVDRVLVSVGFAPNVEDIGLEAAGIELDGRGAIAIDERMRTNVPHIHAIGDVTMKLQLAHVAEAQGIVAAETICGAQTMELGDYRMMPRATFTQPQVASFGLTEGEAVAEGHEVTVVKFPFSANGKAHGLGEPTGFVKLVAGAQHGELLGGHLVGPDVSELLPELTLAQKWDLGAFELARNVHTHPTLSEALQETFHGLTGHMINL